MKLEALVRQKMDTVIARAGKMVVAPTNQRRGILEIEVGTAWRGASGTAAVTCLSFSKHKPASSHARLLCIFPGIWLLFFPTPAGRRPASGSFTLPPWAR